MNFKKSSWEELIIYFTELRENPVLTDKDIVDYFQFRYITNVGIDRWISPNYIIQKPSAKKLINLYGVKFTLELIDTLFDNYKEVFNKSFLEIRWSLGILSSEKTGWIFERVLLLIKNKDSKDKNVNIKNLLDKPRNTWTPEEHLLFLDLNSGEKNGKV